MSYSPTLLVVQLFCHPSKNEGEEQEEREKDNPIFTDFSQLVLSRRHSRTSVFVTVKKIKPAEHLDDTETVIYPSVLNFDVKNLILVVHSLQEGSVLGQSAPCKSDHLAA